MKRSFLADFFVLRFARLCSQRKLESINTAQSCECTWANALPNGHGFMVAFGGPRTR